MSHQEYLTLSYGLKGGVNITCKEKISREHLLIYKEHSAEL